MTEQMRHHPTLLSTGSHGCWSTCSCGWNSALWTTTTGAHLEFGRHMVDSSAPEPTRCSAESCVAAAVEVLVLRGQPGHVHDCSRHAAEVREWCDVVESHPMPCLLACTPALYVAEPTPFQAE